MTHLTIAPGDFADAIPGYQLPSTATLAHYHRIAELKISARLGDLASLDAEVLRFVIIEAVGRRIRNPDAFSRISVSADETSETREYHRSSGNIEITSDEWEMLSPQGDKTAKPLFTIPTLFFHDEVE